MIVYDVVDVGVVGAKRLVDETRRRSSEIVETRPLELEPIGERLVAMW